MEKAIRGAKSEAQAEGQHKLFMERFFGETPGTETKGRFATPVATKKAR